MKRRKDYMSIKEVAYRRMKIQELQEALDKEIIQDIYDTVVNPMFDLLLEEHPDAKILQVHVKATSKSQVKVNLTTPEAKEQLILPFLNCEVTGDIWEYLKKLCERANEFGLKAFKSDRYRLVVFSK